MTSSLTLNMLTGGQYSKYRKNQDPNKLMFCDQVGMCRMPKFLTLRNGKYLSPSQFETGNVKNVRSAT